MLMQKKPACPAWVIIFRRILLLVRRNSGIQKPSFVAADDYIAPRDSHSAELGAFHFKTKKLDSGLDRLANFIIESSPPILGEASPTIFRGRFCHIVIIIAVVAAGICHLGRRGAILQEESSQFIRSSR